MTNDNSKDNYLKSDCNMDNFIERNKSVLLPYEEDEIRKKNTSSRCQMFLVN